MESLDRTIHVIEGSSWPDDEELVDEKASADARLFCHYSRDCRCAGHAIPAPNRRGSPRAKWLERLPIFAPWRDATPTSRSRYWLASPRTAPRRVRVWPPPSRCSIAAGASRRRCTRARMAATFASPSGGSSMTATKKSRGCLSMNHWKVDRGQDPEASSWPEDRDADVVIFKFFR